MYPNAITDHSIVPYPNTPPDPGRAGSAIVDPFAGNTIYRVTDETSDTYQPGMKFKTADSSEASVWSSDSEAFVVMNVNSWSWLYRWTGEGVSQVKRLSGNASNYCFSLSQPRVMWAAQDLSIVQYDPSTDAMTPVVNLRDYPELGIPESPRWYFNSISADWTDDRVAGYIGKAQDESWMIVVWDAKKGLCWLNTQTGEYGGWVSGTIPDWNPYMLHNARLSKNGACLKIGPPESEGHALCFWEPGTGVHQYVNQSVDTPILGHQALGFSHYYGSTQREHPFQFIRAPLFAMSAWEYLLKPDPVPGGSWWDDYHISTQPDAADRNPIFASSSNGSNPTQPGAPLTSVTAGDNEIFAVLPDGSGNWWRFAHHYASGVRGFYSTPRGNVSPNGNAFIFTSDWEGTLADQRHDAFCLRMR